MTDKNDAVHSFQDRLIRGARSKWALTAASPPTAVVIVDGGDENMSAVGNLSATFADFAVAEYWDLETMGWLRVEEALEWLRGRNVMLWPNADTDGKSQRRFARLARLADPICASVLLVDPDKLGLSDGAGAKAFAAKFSKREPLTQPDTDPEAALFDAAAPVTADGWI